MNEANTFQINANNNAGGIKNTGQLNAPSLKGMFQGEEVAPTGGQKY